MTVIRSTLGAIWLVCLAIGASGWLFRPRLWIEESYSKLDGTVLQTQWEFRQRFVLDLLLQVHKPLLQQELIGLGQMLNDDPNNYEPNSWPKLIDFMDRVHQGRILRPYSIYSQLDEELSQQLLSVYRFMSLAKDWRTFQRNACYARIHFNPVLFVNAFELAIGSRSDTKDLMLPGMHEVLPQLYFDKEIIMKAQMINWQQLSLGPTISTKHHWREKLANFINTKWFSPLPDEGIPSNDPIIIEVNPHKAQVIFDVELNGYWNRLISRLMIGVQIPHDYLVFMHNIKQLVAHMKLNALSTETRDWQLIEPALLTTGGVSYRATNLTSEIVLNLINEVIEVLRIQIDEELAKSLDTDHKIYTVGRVIAQQYWILCRTLSLGINGNQVAPNLLGLSTSNLRDPIYRMLLLKLAQLIAQYERSSSVPVHQRGDLKLLQLHIGKLETFDELIDSDLINLMDQQLLQTDRNNLHFLRRRVVARQSRLNHRPFSISFNMRSQSSTNVLIKSYLMPPGRYQQRFLIDSFVNPMEIGENHILRNFPTASTRPSLSDLYEAKQPTNSSLGGRFSCFCCLPRHMLLPRGTSEGIRLQLLVQVIPWDATTLNNSCDWATNFQDWTLTVLASARINVVVHHKDIGTSN